MTMGGIIVQVVMLNVGGLAEEDITCEAGHFALGQNGSVTCNFHRNLRGSRHHVYVAHYPFQTPDDFSGKDILRCSGLNLPSPICKVADGYLFNMEIGDRLTLTIPALKKKFAGRYVCQLVPPDGKQVHLCNLTVQDTFKTEEPTPSTTCRPDAAINIIPIAVHAALSAVMVLLACVVLYYVVKKTKM